LYWKFKKFPFFLSLYDQNSLIERVCYNIVAIALVYMLFAFNGFSGPSEYIMK